MITSTCEYNCTSLLVANFQFEFVEVCCHTVIAEHAD